MSVLRWSVLVLVPALALFGACGGGDDDDSDDSDDAANGRDSDDDDNGSSGSGRDVDIPEIKEGQFSTGTIRIEISGDKDEEFEAEGNGLATGDFTLLTYAADDGTVQISFQAGSTDEPGAIALTTAEVATAGEWGKECTFELEDGANELKGEFECKDLDALQPGTIKNLEVNLKGTFSARR